MPSAHAAGRPPRPARRDASAGPWRFARLLDAPHRLGFLVGSAMLSTSALWWLATLVAQVAAGSELRWAVAPAHAHALLMGFSFMPMFFAGFLFTAGPRWLGLAAVPARRLLPTAVAWLAGWGVFLAGVHLDARIAAFGLAIAAAGWTLFAWRFAALLTRSAAADRTHLRIIAIACGVGAAVLWAAAAGLAIDDDALLGASLFAGLWAFLAPVFATAMHRMVPFLGVAVPRLDERHPLWLLVVLLAVLPAQAPLGAALARGGAAALATMAVDAAAAALVLGLALRWRAIQNLRIRLLAMLDIGFAWLGVALALQAVAAAQAWTGRGAGQASLAGLHALAMGFFGSIQFAFVTRVSAGQAGRAHAIDGLAWALFLVVQAAVVLRIAAAWRPDLPVLLLAAAALWTAAVLTWSVRHAGWYGRPRIDGRPG
ncbi:MAG: NnrS family protein [Burkholderiaceae bacterium]|nr:NnrS family protein [Burkholderiaceae bacterium]